MLQAIPVLWIDHVRQHLKVQYRNNCNETLIKNVCLCLQEEFHITVDYLVGCFYQCSADTLFILSGSHMYMLIKYWMCCAILFHDVT